MRITADWNTLDNKAKKRLAHAFAQALQSTADFWAGNENDIDEINDHLQYDLEKFPRQILEHMLLHDAEVE
jgi:hypothetical protein